MADAIDDAARPDADQQQESTPADANVDADAGADAGAAAGAAGIEAVAIRDSDQTGVCQKRSGLSESR